MSADPKDDSFAAMFEQQAPVPARRRPALRVGDRIEGIVVHAGKDAVFVELDEKQQAYIEAIDLREPDGTMSVKEGDKLTAQVVQIDEATGSVRLGRSMGKAGSVAALEQAMESMMPVEGKVTGVNKGGLEVDFQGTRGFCPISQADSKYLDDPKGLVGQTLSFLVTLVREGGKNVVVSRRALLQREAKESAARLMTDIVPGAVLRGSITAVRDFGAFVDLGGVEGLIPRSEIGHDRAVAVADALKAGDGVEVRVLEVKDVEAARPGAPVKKIILSLKALMADPWAELDLVEGRVMAGTVTRSVEFGRFVRLAPGIEGLLHVSELGRSVRAEEGEEIRVVVKKVDREAKKIALIPAPDGVAAGSTVVSVAVSVGAIVQGAVDRIENYGVFVQLDGTKGRAGRGLVPVAELGVVRGTDLRKVFPEGTKVTAKVLETGDGRLRLSIKGAKADEERADYEAARGTQNVPVSLGTFADLLKKKR